MQFRLLQGQSGSFIFTVTVNGNTVDLSIYDNIILVVMDSAKKIVARFSRETIAGYTPLDATNQAAGVIGIVLTDEVTIKYPNVQLYHVILTEANSASDPYFSGSMTAEEMVFIERSPLPIVPSVSA